MGWFEQRERVLGRTLDPPDSPIGEEKRPCVIQGCQDPSVDIVYCADHRRMADDGTLWLRCVFDGGHAPVAPNDPVACAEHRQQMNETVMPWDAP